MERRRLGRSEFEVTVIGLGTWAIGGGGYAFGWGPQDDADSARTIGEALEAGINWIDTAPVYGLGHSEEVVGRALRGLGERPLVFTKMGIRWDDRGRVLRELVPERVEDEVDGSLRRLGVEPIDLMQIHWPVPDERIEHVWERLCTLREKGKLRAVGVCNFDAAQLERISRIDPPVSNQPPFNVLQRQIADDSLPLCRERGIGVIPYSPMLSGLLSSGFDRKRVEQLADDDWRKGLPLLGGERLESFLALVDRLAGIAREVGADLSTLAIAWVLAQEGVTGAIVGARRPGQILETVEAAELSLEPEVFAAIDDAVDAFGDRTLSLY